MALFHNGNFFKPRVTILSTKDPFRLFSLDMSKTAGIFRLEFHKSQSESHEGFVYVHENAVLFFV